MCRAVVSLNIDGLREGEKIEIRRKRIWGKRGRRGSERRERRRSAYVGSRVSVFQASARPEPLLPRSFWDAAMSSFAAVDRFMAYMQKLAGLGSLNIQAKGIMERYGKSQASVDDLEMQVLVREFGMIKDAEKESETKWASFHQEQDPDYQAAEAFWMIRKDLAAGNPEDRKESGVAGESGTEEDDSSEDSEESGKRKSQEKAGKTPSKTLKTNEDSVQAEIQAAREGYVADRVEEINRASGGEASGAAEAAVSEAVGIREVLDAQTGIPGVQNQASAMQVDQESAAPSQGGGRGSE